MNKTASALLLALAATMTSAYATGPDHLRIDLVKPSKTIQFASTEPDPSRYEVRISKWTAAGLEPTRDVLAYPPVFGLAPKGSQAVKIVSRVKPGAVQGTYRLQFIAIEGAALSFSMPVFVPSADKAAKPSLSFERGADGLAVVNSGAITERITEVQVGGKWHNELIYVLPQSSTKIGAKVQAVKGDTGELVVN